MITPDDKILHEINTDSIKSKNNWPVVLGVVVGMIIFGVSTGYMLKTFSSGNSAKNNTSSESNSNNGTKESAGILDKETFKDKAEGMLKEGGFEGEGSFHLERPGGVSQNVYLTSTTVDLNEFLGKKVRIWGATFSSKKAGWLMDVGYIEIMK